jgi:hypothetical protein
MDDDIRYLDLLGIFHYVVAGILALFGLFPIFHLIMGIAIVTGSFDGAKGGSPPDWFGLIFVLAALFMMLCMWALAVAVCLAGSRLRRHSNYTYCLVVAALECMFTPIGTVLGVFTIIVLVRPTVKALFGESPPRAASS